jgi:lipopolysaccharide assembly outer membrane protein LptD (OstA)
MSKTRLALVALLVVTAAVTLFLVLAPAPKAPPPRPTEAVGLTLRGYEEGALAWEAAAERGEMGSESGALEGIVLRAFRGESETLRVDARELEQKGNALTLSGDVRGETTDGLAISSEKMTWTTDARRLTSDWTVLDWGDDELTAEAFEYDARAEEAWLTDVRGTLKRDRAYVFSSDRAGISRERIVLSGGVEAASRDETVRADELEADRETNAVALRGNVSASVPGIELRADELVLGPDGRTARGSVSVDVDVTAEGASDGA